MITFDFRAFEREARFLGAAADQIPFALAQSLNDGAEAARTYLNDVTWPSHVKARDPSFLKNALTTSGRRASKRRLSVTLWDKRGRASLLEHAEGGLKRARKTNLALPSKAYVQPSRTARGIPRGLKPAALKNSFVAQSKYGPVVFQREPGPKKTKGGKSAGGTNPTGRIRPMYGLAPAVRIKPDVPFEADFNTVVTREVWRAFGPRLSAAMASRRP